MAAGTAASAGTPTPDPEPERPSRTGGRAAPPRRGLRPPRRDARAAERVAEGYSEVPRGGTHQARLERDAAEAYTRRRLAALDIGDTPLCFGRLDLLTADGLDAVDRRRPVLHRPPLGHRRRPHARSSSTGARPVAEPFYRATAVEPMGVVRRRHFQTHGRRAHRPRRRGVRRRRRRRRRASPSWGRARCSPRSTGSAPAACATSSPPSRPSRTRRSAPTSPGSSSSPAAPAPARPRSRCTAPRTSSTRTASGSASQGVLLVGPSPIFLRYIEQVLPSLGEDEVQPRHAAGAEAAAAVRGTESAGHRRGEGRRAHGDGDRRRASATASARCRATSSSRSTATCCACAGATAGRIVERAHARRGTHNERRPYVAGLLLDHFARVPPRARRAVPRRARLDADAAARATADRSAATYDPTVAAPLARGEARARRSGRTSSRSRSARIPEVRAALERMWPVLSGAELVHDLFSFEALIRSAADGVLTATSRRCCSATAVRDVRDVAWTEADLAAGRRGRRAARAAERGPAPPAPPARASRGRPRGRARARSPSSAWAVHHRRRRRSPATAPTRPAASATTTASCARSGTCSSTRPRTSPPMQWRMLARRCPSGSMTIVGDFGQASRPGAPRELGRGARATSPCACRRAASTLTVNYRTPPRSWTSRTGCSPPPRPASSRPGSVRSTGAHPEVLAVGARRAGRARSARAARGSPPRGGTVAVIAPLELHAALIDALADRRRGRRRRRGASTRPSRCSTRPRREGPRVRPRHRGRAGAPRRPRPRRAAPALRRAHPRPPAGSSVVHAEPLPEALGRSRLVPWAHDLHLHRTVHALVDEPTAPPPTSPGTSSRSSTAAARPASTRCSTTPRRGRTRWRRTAGRIAELDAAGLAELMHELAALGDLGRTAGSYAGLRFAVDTTDPAARRADRSASRSGPPRSTTSSSSSSSSGPRSPTSGPTRCSPTTGSTFCRHYLASGAPLPPAPAHRARGADPRREVVTGQQRVGPAVLASSRPRSRSTSTATHGEPRSRACRGCCRPTATCAAAAAEAVTAALAPGLRTRAFVFNTLLADKATDDRLRRYPQLDREPQPRQRGERRVGAGARRRGAGALRHPAALVRAEGAAARARPLADYDRMASVATADAGVRLGRGARARARRVRVVLARARRRSADRFFDESWIDAPMRPGKRPGAFCAYTVPSQHPYLLLNWTAPPARRAHARPRARSRPARVPRARPGRLPPDHAAHAGRDRVGVRRDGHVRPPARRDRRSRRARSRCSPRASRARSRPCSARSR